MPVEKGWGWTARPDHLWPHLRSKKTTTKNLFWAKLWLKNRQLSTSWQTTGEDALTAMMIPALQIPDLKGRSPCWMDPWKPTLIYLLSTYTGEKTHCKMTGEIVNFFIFLGACRVRLLPPLQLPPVFSHPASKPCIGKPDFPPHFWAWEVPPRQMLAVQPQQRLLVAQHPQPTPRPTCQQVGAQRHPTLISASKVMPTTPAVRPYLWIIWTHSNSAF